jgi:hypothetical protein
MIALNTMPKAPIRPIRVAKSKVVASVFLDQTNIVRTLCIDRSASFFSERHAV